MENDIFEKAPVPKAYFTLSLPVVFSMVISLVYNMVDTYFIARTGNMNLIAGVSLGAPIFTLMIALGDIFGLGGSSVISRLFGQQKDGDGKRISVFCFYASIAIGILVTAVMLLFRAPILQLLGADKDTQAYASQYYTFLVLGASFIILSFTPSNLLRTEGHAAASMKGSVLGTVVNIILDPVFISVLGLGAAGAAIATVIGYISMDLYFIWFLLKKSKKLSVYPKGMYLKAPELGQILAIGIPASVTNLMQSFCIALTNRFLLPYGNDKVAAMGIVMKINMIAALILVGFAFGGQPLVGYNYGSGNRKRLREILKFSYLFECGLAILLTAVLSLLAKPLIGLFLTGEEDILLTGIPMLRFQLAGMVFVAIVLITTCTFQAAGKAWGAFVLSISRQGIVFALVIFLLSRVAGYYGVLAAQACADLITAGIAAYLLRKGL